MGNVRIVYFALQNPSLVQARILAMQTSFLKISYFKSIHDCIEKLNNKVVIAIPQLRQLASEDKLNPICLRILLTLESDNFAAISYKLLTDFGILLQMYWLTFLDNWFVSKFMFEYEMGFVREEAIHTLVIFTLPEIAYSPACFNRKLLFQFFHKEVVDMLIQGTLPTQIKCVSRQRFKKLKDIALYLNPPVTVDFLVIQGTICGVPHFKNPNSVIEYLPFNTLLISHKGRCVFLWEKQKVSKVDPRYADYIVRDVIPVEYTIGNYFSPMCMLQNIHNDPSPIFQFVNEFCTCIFGVSICMDIWSASEMLGNKSVNIQVLVACDLHFNWLNDSARRVKAMVSAELFLLCDGRGASAMFNCKDKIWTKSNWTEVDVTKAIGPILYPIGKGVIRIQSTITDLLPPPQPQDE